VRPIILIGKVLLLILVGILTADLGSLAYYETGIVSNALDIKLNDPSLVSGLIAQLIVAFLVSGVTLLCTLPLGFAVRKRLGSIGGALVAIGFGFCLAVLSISFSSVSGFGEMVANVIIGLVHVTAMVVLGFVLWPAKTLNVHKVFE